MTTTFLSNATIAITQGATTTVLSGQANTISMSVGYEPLDSTAFGDTGRRMVQGLQSVDVTIDFFLSYGATEVEAILYSCLGTGTTTLTISPSGSTESASNPEYVISNCMLASFTPINSSVGTLSTVSAQFTSGSWLRDITAP
jgi:hypothetical protein